jgi:hypothetical protein
MMDWTKWLRMAGISDDDVKHGPVLNRASKVIDAAINGQGIALARTTLAAWDLINGVLVRPFAESLRISKTCWIICPKATSNPTRIVTFRDWLLAEASQCVSRRSNAGHKRSLKRAMMIAGQRGRKFELLGFGNRETISGLVGLIWPFGTTSASMWGCGPVTSQCAARLREREQESPMSARGNLIRGVHRAIARNILLRLRSFPGLRRSDRGECSHQCLGAHGT